MRKIFMLVALAALAFTSCVKEDGTFKRLEPVMPGMNIYNGTMTMHRVAMQPADMVMRLAIVQEEAYKQDPAAVDPDLTKVMVNDKKDNLFTRMFGQKTTLSKTEAGYKLVFESDEINEFYRSQGTIEIKTNGKRLDQTSPLEPWAVTLGADYNVVVYSSAGDDILEAAATSLEIYREDNTFQIELRGFKANVKDKTIKSNWNSTLELKLPATAASLAYSDIKGKDFGVKASGAGPSCVTFDGKASTELSMEISGMTQNYLLMMSGSAVCKLTGINDYNASYYTATQAEVKWTPTGDNKLIIMLTYNNITENVSGYIR